MAVPGRRLARPELEPLVAELARRFEAGDALVSVTLRGLPLPSRQVLADLLGAERVPPPLARVRVDKLLAALGLGSPAELRAEVEALRGTLPDRRAERQAVRAERAALWTWLAAETATIGLGGPPGRLAWWVEEQRSSGVRGDVATHRRRLETAIRVLRALPADSTPLSSLASDYAGGPHALDHGTTLGTMVLDGVAAGLGLPRPAGAEAARAAWEAVGVAPDPHSSTVLALGLPGADENPLRRWLAAAAGGGEPVVMSLSNLRRWPLPPLPATATLVVVENPALVAEAAGSWPGPPLVCSSGRPTVATVTLLRQLGGSGATLLQHADFDPSGLSITAWLAERAGTIPWRMSRADYLSAVPPGAPADITGPVPATPWDPALAGAVEEVRAAVYEEAVRVSILDAARTYR